MQEIQRSPRRPFRVSLAAEVVDSDLLPMGLVSAFSVYIPATVYGPTTISFYGAAAPEDIFLPIYLSDGSLAKATTQGGRIIVAPPELFSVPLLKATSTIPFTATILSKG